jgi:hypothetical protein
MQCGGKTTAQGELDGCRQSKEDFDGVRPTAYIFHLPTTWITAHLRGDIHAGLYPLMAGDTCRLLACDFDGSSVLLDALAYAKAPSASDRCVVEFDADDGGHSVEVDIGSQQHCSVPLGH